MITDWSGILKENLAASIRAKEDMLGDATQIDVFARATEAVVQRYRSGGRLYIAGNGGSAADAQHLAAEFISKLARERAPLPAEALTTDTSTLTAIGNDYGYEQVFARQIAGKATAKDAFLAITTSGVSLNILRALEQCRKQGVLSVLFTGRDELLQKVAYYLDHPVERAAIAASGMAIVRREFSAVAVARKAMQFMRDYFERQASGDATT